MSTTIERKVKKKPVMVHRPKKVINSKEKSLHRSLLSHSRIATGYKKKIAALLGNNRALAHALELAHIELNNRDKLTVELQRRLTIQSPKRFKAKLQKVCEHLHVIVALLQDILDDCEEECNLGSFNLQTSTCSRPDINGGHENESPLVTDPHSPNSLVNNDTEINATPFHTIQQPPRLTTAAEMSAILEQSVLSADENLPPILFPEDESKVISNITTRPRSKSRSASSKPGSRGSKIHSESPQKRKSSSATNFDNGNNNEVCAIELSPHPPPLVSFQPSPSPKRNSSPNKIMHKEDSQSPIPVNFLNGSQNDFISPEKISKGEKCVKRKTVSKEKEEKSKRKSRKNILVVKLACTPKRSLAHENTEDTIAKEHLNSVTSKKSPSGRTYIVNKTEKVNPASEVPNSEPLKTYANKALSLPDQFYNGHDDDTNSAKSKKGNRDSDKATDAQYFNTATRNDNTCIISQDMDLTCQSLTNKTNTDKYETGDLNSLSTNSIKPIPNSPCSSLMYGYDPLEGTSRNKKSSILLKKPKSSKSKSSSKIPQAKSKPKPIDNKICNSDARVKCINAESYVVKKASLQNSPTKSNSQGDELGIKVTRLLPNHSPAKESTALMWTESNRYQEVSSLCSVQPVVELNDIFTSVKSPSPAKHSNNYVYIPDSLAGGVLKVDTTPKRKTLKLGSDLITQNSNKEETKETRSSIPTDAAKKVKTISEKVDNSAAADEKFNSDGIRKRRTAPVSYKEPSVNKKLRQGDPFTSGSVTNWPKKERPRSCIVKKSYFEGNASDSD